MHLSELEVVTSDDTASPAVLSNGSLAVFSITPLDTTGPGDGTGPFLLIYSLLPPLKTCNQTMPPSTWVLLIAVIYCTVPSIPSWSFRNLVPVSLSLSTTLLQLYLLVISILTKTILPISWPPSSLAELERLFNNFSLLFCLNYNFGHTLSLSLPITQTLLWSQIPHSPTTNPSLQLTRPTISSPMILWTPTGNFCPPIPPRFHIFLPSQLLSSPSAA